MSVQLSLQREQTFRVRTTGALALRSITLVPGFAPPYLIVLRRILLSFAS